MIKLESFVLYSRKGQKGHYWWLFSAACHRNRYPHNELYTGDYPGYSKALEESNLGAEARSHSFTLLVQVPERSHSTKWYIEKVRVKL